MYREVTFLPSTRLLRVSPGDDSMKDSQCLQPIYKCFVVEAQTMLEVEGIWRYVCGTAQTSLALLCKKPLTVFGNRKFVIGNR